MFIFQYTANVLSERIYYLCNMTPFKNIMARYHLPDVCFRINGIKQMGTNIIVWKVKEFGISGFHSSGGEGEGYPEMRFRESEIHRGLILPILVKPYGSKFHSKMSQILFAETENEEFP